MDEPEDEPALVDRLFDKPAAVDEPKDESAAGEDVPPIAAPVRMRRSSRWGPVGMVVLEMLGLFCAGKMGGCLAYDCANSTNQVSV